MSNLVVSSNPNATVIAIESNRIVTSINSNKTIIAAGSQGPAGYSDIAPAIHSALEITTPVNADELAIANSATSFSLVKLKWSNLKATLKTYFDTLYPSGSGTSTGSNTGDQDLSGYSLTSHNHTGIYAPVLGTDDNYVTDAQLATLINTSGVNTGDQNLSGYSLTSHDHTGIYAPVLGANDNYVTDAQLVVISNTSGVNTGDQNLSGYSLTSHNHTGVYAPVLGTDDNYVTDAQLVVISNTSGVNTGDQNLSGYSLTSHNHTGVYAPVLGTDDNYVTDAQLVVLSNTSGVNTGDQNLSGYSLTSHNHTGVYAPVLGTDDNYVTDAQLVVLSNTSGVNTGDNATNSLYSSLVTNATHTGDATGSGSLTVVAINGTNLAGLGTGILKNTTATGVPSIAIAADFPTLNQNTSGNAATVTTNANLSGHVTSVGNTTSLGSFTLAQLNAAISDADIPTSVGGDSISPFLLMGA